MKLKRLNEQDVALIGYAVAKEELADSNDVIHLVGGKLKISAVPGESYVETVQNVCGDLIGVEVGADIPTMHERITNALNNIGIDVTVSEALAVHDYQRVVRLLKAGDTSLKKSETSALGTEQHAAIMAVNTILKQHGKETIK